MLRQTSHRTFRAVSGLISPVKSIPFSPLFGTVHQYAHVRLYSVTAMSPLLGAQISRQVSIRALNESGSFGLRAFSTVRTLRKDDQGGTFGVKSAEVNRPEGSDYSTLEFKRTEKGEAAKAVDLSARLKERSPQPEKGEVIRLLKLAGREWRILSGDSLIIPSILTAQLQLYSSVFLPV